MTHENEAANHPDEAGNPTGTVAARCIDIVEQYRAETISKGDAIYEFAKAIPVGEDGTTEAPGKTLKSYISMLDDWDHERTLSETDEQREETQREKHNSGARDKGHKGWRPSSPTWSGSRYCRASPSTLTLYSADGTQQIMTTKSPMRSETSQS